MFLFYGDYTVVGELVTVDSCPVCDDAGTVLYTSVVVTVRVPPVEDRPRDAVHH